MIFASQEDERQFTIPESTRRVIVPNGTQMIGLGSDRDPAVIRDRFGLQSGFTCIFVGTYDCNPNMKAAKTVINDIAPDLSHVEFLFVGRNPPENVAANVYTPGYVDELADVLADVALYPL